MNDDEVQLQKAQIIGTHNFSLHYSCVECNRLHEITELSRCSNCKLLQALRSCKVEAAVNIYFETNDDKLTLTAHTAVIRKLIEYLTDQDDLRKTESILLTANPPLMTVMYSTNGSYIKDVQFNDKHKCYPLFTLFSFYDFI